MVTAMAIISFLRAVSHDDRFLALNPLSLARTPCWRQRRHINLSSVRMRRNTLDEGIK